MEIAFTKKGWLNIRTDEIIPFGDLAVDVYNLTHKKKEYVDKKICQGFNIKSCFISGRNMPDCNSQKQLFDSNKSITAIIWSEEPLLSSSNRQYIFDGAFKDKN